MRMNFCRLLAAAGATALMVAALPAAALATDSKMAMQMAKSPVRVGGLQISGAFARATLPGAPTGGGYLTIVNTGKTADRLVSALSPAAGTVSLHKMSMDGSVMKMEVLPHGIDIPAGATVKLTPSGLHMMFEHLKGPLVQGKTVPVTLGFEHAGTVSVELEILGIAAAAPMQDMSM
jgi:copper(I)-binding protein